MYHESLQANLIMGASAPKHRASSNKEAPIYFSNILSINVFIFEWTKGIICWCTDRRQKERKKERKKERR